MDIERGKTGEGAKLGHRTDAVVEFRRYRLVPGGRERLIDLFDSTFVEPQEAVGMRVIGQFRDLDDPHAFVWLRGFADMPSRAEALGAFYGGPVWAAQRDEANGTMVNSDNVLLLRPAFPASGFMHPDEPREGINARGQGKGLIVATTCHLAPRTEDDFAAFFEESVRPGLLATSARVLATLVTERSPNTFARLPVREGETVFVWFSGFADQHAYDRHLEELFGLESWTRDVVPEMERRTWRPNDVVRLQPTARSLLHG